MSYLTGTNQELIYANIASGTAKASFTTEANLNDTAGMGERPSLPPSFWAPPYGVGKGLRIKASGIVSSTATPTYTLTIRLGTNGAITGPIILGTVAMTTASGISNQLWTLEGDIIMRTIGTAGANSTVQGIGWCESGGFASPFVFAAFGGAAQPGTVATVDASITNYINVSVACSASSASNTITLLQLLVWGLN
jgi:hypothetical protein